MKKLRIVAFLLILCMFSAMLFACNGGSSDSSETEGTSQTTGTTTGNNNQGDNNNTGNENTGNNNTGNNNTGNNSGNTNTPTIDNNKLVSYVDAVEEFNGEKFDITNVDLGQGSYMHIAKNTTLEKYEAFNKYLEDNGAVLYDSNKIGDNRFSTYISKSQIITVMFLAYDYDEEDTSNYPVATSIDHNEVRIIIDERPYFDLYTREQDNKYTPSTDSKVAPRLIMLSDNKVTWPGRMGFLYQLADGSFFIMDGGYWGAGGNYTANAMNPTKSSSVAHTIFEVMKAHAPDPENIVVAGWFISHTHEDHLGAFVDISLTEEYRNKITIETIIHNTPSDGELLSETNGQLILEIAHRLEESIERFKKSTSPNINIIKAHGGQKMYFRDLAFEIYTSQSTLLYSTDVSTGANFTHAVNHNDTSILSRVYYQDTTAMYFADSWVQTNRLVINPLYRRNLDCDMLQPSHHGYSDTKSGISYKHLSTPPKMVLWPDCRGHYDGKNPDGSVYYENSKPYGGVLYIDFNQAYLVKPGVTQVYLIDNTCAVITDFKNLNTFNMVDYVK